MIEYDEGTPAEIGVYACRVPMVKMPSLCEDIFLMWDGTVWAYLGSDQSYRGEVPFFVGPLRRARIQQRAPTLHELFITPCPICGSPLFDSPSGVVCSNGHGGVE